MIRVSMLFGFSLLFLSTALSTPLPAPGEVAPTSNTNKAGLDLHHLNLLTLNSTPSLGNSWDPRIKCFTNPPRYPSGYPYEPIIYADFLQALAKISDMPSFNEKRTWPVGKSTSWEYNKAGIWMRARAGEPTTEDLRFAPSFVALVARLIDARCITPTTDKLGGSAKFGPDSRFTVMVDALGELSALGVATA